MSGLKRLANDLGLTDTVRFLGWVEDPHRLRDIIASSDVGIEPCPSNPFNDQSTMIKLTEYLAAGRPVVAYDLPEHRVTVGDAGVFVPPSLGHSGLAHAIVRMAANPPMPMGVMQASVPPQIIMPASPRWMMRNESPMEWALVVQAVAVAEFGPLAPVRIET